jgi:hypothetical protein
LTIMLPKRAEALHVSRRIEVQSGGNGDAELAAAAAAAAAAA